MLKRKVIGSDFELKSLQLGQEAQRIGLTRNLSGTWTASGRSALYLILSQLRAMGVNHVHLPSYLCDSLLQPVKALGMMYSFYPVDAELTAHPDPPQGAAVLLIHYFGWINPAAAALRAEAGERFFLIEDASQALLSDWSALPNESRFVLLSPRKFGPLPFGGWCSIQVELDQPSTEIDNLAWRSLAARLVRAAYLAEPDSPLDLAVERFYLDTFRAVEEYLDAHTDDTAVPQIVLDILAGLNWEEIATRRRRNWQFLNEIIAQTLPPLIPDLDKYVVPLGFVIRLPRRDTIQAYLASQRIFCPVHWPLPQEVSAHRFPVSARLAETCITLPIDQRYGCDEMEQIADVLKGLL